LQPSSWRVPANAYAAREAIPFRSRRRRRSEYERPSKWLFIAAVWWTAIADSPKDQTSKPIAPAATRSLLLRRRGVAPAVAEQSRVRISKEQEIAPDTREVDFLPAHERAPAAWP
jgi:hypothetical protein